VGINLEYDAKIKNRVKRAEGQLRGILRMMDENKECKDVITQISAARTALDRIIAVVVSSNLEKCVRESLLTGKETADFVQEAVQLLVKSR
jgi:DNA-binding FrmR family transcriptional regulator